ncbi:MAG: DUF5615 family PIN-like protein [Bifidobacteriaceae bacterium]|jgi:hypothetical protein|nr:DUF5615 family PIN-like protein [Bifidobacteriaceae bacterium]
MTAGRPVRLLLDEHYPPWLARRLREGGVDAVAVLEPTVALAGAPDAEILRVAAHLGRVVVTEDVTTFGGAIESVPGHCGVVYCHPARFSRTRPGLARLADALAALAATPPPGLGALPLVWWLDTPAN